MKHTKKITILHSNDMHGDFLAEQLDNKLVGGVSMLSGYVEKVRREEKNVLYASVLQEVRELLEAYDVGSWNGFKGSNRMALDGESFGFYVEFTDGSVISAYGTNSFPPHYQEVYSALWDLTAPAQEAYESEHPEESSTL